MQHADGNRTQRRVDQQRRQQIPRHLGLDVAHDLHGVALVGEARCDLHQPAQHRVPVDQEEKHQQKYTEHGSQHGGCSGNHIPWTDRHRRGRRHGGAIGAVDQCLRGAIGGFQRLGDAAKFRHETLDCRRGTLKPAHRRLRERTYARADTHEQRHHQHAGGEPARQVHAGTGHHDGVERQAYECSQHQRDQQRLGDSDGVQQCQQQQHVQHHAHGAHMPTHATHAVAWETRPWWHHVRAGRCNQCHIGVGVRDGSRYRCGLDRSIHCLATPLMAGCCPPADRHPGDRPWRHAPPRAGPPPRIRRTVA